MEVWKQKGKKNKCWLPIRQFYTYEYVEIWRNTEVKTSTPLKHNQALSPSGIRVEIMRFIIDTSVKLKINVTKNLNRNYDN